MQAHSDKKPTALKSVHIDQCTKLQQKYQQDLELLEDLRLFMKQRSVIEKVYAQSLCKLIQQTMAKRSFPVRTTGDATMENTNQQNKSLLEIWRNVLNEVNNVATVRLAAADTYLQHISEPCKQIRANRVQVSKMVFEELNNIQKDLMLSIQEMTKSQKFYREEEHIAQDARIKASNADNKLKNKSIGRFSSLAKLEQQNLKMNTRLESCEVKSTAARNEYLLNLAAANAHLSRYYSVDVPDLMQILDGDLFDVWKHFLNLFSETELQCSSTTSECFNRSKADANKISRQYDLRCFLQENQILTNIVNYPFLPQDNDQVRKVSKNHQAELDLDREARKWSVKIARENRIIRENVKTLNQLKEEKNKVHNNSFEFSQNASAASAELKPEEARINIRAAEILKAKAEARIEALREGGVDVDVWLNSANETVLEEEEEINSSNGKLNSSSASNVSYGKGDLAPSMSQTTLDRGGGELDRKNRIYANVKDGDSFNATLPPSPSEAANRMIYPIWCVAVYDYQAANDDELTIRENENLEVLGEGDSDGWMRARNNHGQEGLVAENYIRAWNPVADGGPVDHNEVNVDDGRAVPNDAASKTKVLRNPVYAVIPATIPTPGEKWARALYDYEATCEEELSFQEGQLIRITSTEHDGVDDGWWEGEVNGGFGVFPSLVVEELLPVRNSEAFSREVSQESENNQTSGDGDNVFDQQTTQGNDNRLLSSNFQYLFNEGTESAV